MAIRYEKIKLEMSNSNAAESRNEDANASDYGVFTYNKQKTAITGKQKRIDRTNLAKACDHYEYRVYNSCCSSV